MNFIYKFFIQALISHSTSLTFIGLALTLVTFISPLHANDKCDAVTGIKTIAVSPSYECKTGYHELYKQSVSKNVFEAQNIANQVEQEVSVIRTGLKDEAGVQNYYEYISDDSSIDESATVTIRNKSNNQLNYALDPTAKAEQSVGAVR